jgi:hypothetical protein
MATNDLDVVREAVGVFDSYPELEQAVDELLRSGFDRAEVSLMANESTVVEKLGHKYRRVTELEDDETVPRTAYASTESVGDAEGAIIGGLMYVAAGVLLGPVAFAGGSLVAIASAAAIGAGVGGLVGLPLAGLVAQDRARHIKEQLDHGGLLLWVRVVNEGRERKAVTILKQHSGRDVHVHEVGATGGRTDRPGR